MKRTIPALAAVSALALGLAACSGDADSVDEATTDEAATENTLVVEEGPRTDLTLTPEQQTALDGVDTDAVNEEYATIRTEMDQEMASGSTGSGTTGSTGAASTTSTGNDADAMAASSDTASSAGGTSMPSRSNMDFAFLDRNSDDQLSVAEYAIWAVGVNPTEPKPNDNTRPFLTEEQINQAGQSFFYYDQDGNSYLSEAEFTRARNREA